MTVAEFTAVVFSIQRYSLQDGPGIRTTVFLKGCPLCCWWCSNPESQVTHPEIVHRNSLCNKCERCLAACDKGAIALHEQGVRIDRRLCDNCGQCIGSCYQGALKLFGSVMTAGQVFDEAIRDELFYRNSGGGVTVSGGEPLARPDFVAELFQLCRAADVSTCVETSGHVSQAAIHSIVPMTDLVLFDLKHVDPADHRRYTQRSNRRILDNAQLAARLARAIIFRVPLIPTVNDSAANLAATADFVKSLGDGAAIELMPYHRYGVGKYEMLDRPYLLPELVSPDERQHQEAVEIVSSRGVACRVVI